MNQPKNPSYLNDIDIPEDLRQLPETALGQVADELRDYLLNSVSHSSGHFASGLGTVELTIALHYVYETPFDQIVWDVGHQAYPHKILTGRKHQLQTIRQTDGLHPFPWREESPYDTFSVGHSSTSISAALGMSIAARLENQQRKVVAIIGDGALTGGMAFEALNHAGDLHEDMLVIINDNEMSISENVGALNNYLARLLSGKLYTSIRESSKKALQGLPTIKELAKRTEEHLKGMVVPGTLFEELGFNYIGPVDGHHLPTLVDTLKNMRQMKGPQILHIMTQKGKGYAPAEADPIGWHAVPKFNHKEFKKPATTTLTPTYTQVFGQWLCDMAALDPKLMAITPAMREGSGLVPFSKAYPDRYFDVAIAEQHAVTLAAGLACAGFHPVVAIYSTFLQRGFDQLIHDVAIQNLPVLFAIDRAGIVGNDGATHQGAFDLAYLRCVPNLVIMTPADENECRQMLYTGFQLQQPVAVRYPRGVGTGVALDPNMRSLPIGQGRVLRQGKQYALLNFGHLLAEAEVVANALDLTLIDMRFVKPLDRDLLQTTIATHAGLITLEEGVIAGGAGSAVNEVCMALKASLPILNIGLPDAFIKHGDTDEIRHSLHLHADGILEQVKTYFNLH
ncbi:MAG: 1-deoxy-D-xylulose-5-phosphate synthase [Shewanellaceae bacterium]|nr:1-deoxy-D-xylulose-5-phosphate synthase [Shewanellaceae bacterium]